MLLREGGLECLDRHLEMRWIINSTVTGSTPFSPPSFDNKELHSSSHHLNPSTPLTCTTLLRSPPNPPHLQVAILELRARGPPAVPAPHSRSQSFPQVLLVELGWCSRLCRAERPMWAASDYLTEEPSLTGTCFLICTPSSLL